MYDGHNPSMEYTRLRRYATLLLLSITTAACQQVEYPDAMNSARFPPCPETPNCVSSKDTRRSHSTQPLSYTGSMDAAMTGLMQAIQEIPGSRVVEAEGDYVRATFTSRVFRFIDDMEFQFEDGEKRIHMRSASRIGYSDMGVNRRRCEAIRRHFLRLQQEPG